MAKTLLLLSKHESDVQFVSQVATVTKQSLRHVTDPVTAAALIRDGEVGMVFMDGSTEAQYLAFEKAIQDSIGLYSDHHNANSIHALFSCEIQDVPYLTGSPLLGHFVMRSEKDPQGTGAHYARMVQASMAERAFGLERFLAPGTKIQVVKLENSTKKRSAVEAVKSYLVAAHFQSRMATVIANAVDELLMNAIFDAPTDGLGRPTLGATLRSTSMALEGRHAVELHVGFDGNIVGLTAVDLFGSLDKRKLLSHISMKYTKEEYKIKSSTASAGLGLATVFHTGGSFFFASESRVRTEVTVFFAKTENFRAFKDQFRFISTQFYF